MIRMNTVAKYLADNTGISPDMFSAQSSEYLVLSYSNNEQGIKMTRRYKGSIKITELHKFRDVIPVEIYLKDWHQNNGNADEDYNIDTWEQLSDTLVLMVIDYNFRESVKLVELLPDEDYDFQKTVILFGREYKEVEIEEPKGM